MSVSSVSKCLASIKSAVDRSSTAPIIALYFAASWCPDCVASKPFVSEIFKSQVTSKVFDLVYVSSDSNSDQMKGEMEDGWDSIPFEQEEIRSNIKRAFGVCASKEMRALGITSEQKKGGIPTLILIAKENGNVLSSDAIPDIMGNTAVSNPLDHWRSMLDSNDP